MKVILEKISAISKRHILTCALLSVIINMMVEAISRKSVLSLFEYIIDRPYVFFYNSLIIMLTFLPVLFFRRRSFYYAIVSFVWIAFGITNSIMLIFRTTPFTAVDLLLIGSAIKVLNKYFTMSQLLVMGILLGLLFIFAVIFSIRAFFKAPKYTEKLNYTKYICIYLAAFVLFFIGTQFGLSKNYLAANFGNIADAFKTYGFPYCFSNSIFNTGIDKPDDYSEDLVLEILYDIEHEKDSDSIIIEEDEEVNIIFLQLESFFDVGYLTNISVSEDPIPTFGLLKDIYSSGFVRVPSVGAGTANTEFEIITGMNLDFFGPGEYPYKTVLQDNTCESYPFVLRDLGYATHAIHNNVASFYDRDTVFANIGFETFTSIENMTVEELTPNGWAKDFYLTESIMDCLVATEDKADYIYTISVQPHGKYPEEINEEEYDIFAYNEDGTVNPAYTYYISQLREVDDFLGRLIRKLGEYDENVVLVMYGDHLPSLGITDETLENGDIYQTEYIIWDNFGLDKVNRDLEAYQLGAYVFERLEIDNGILSAYHRFFANDEDYLEKLQVIQYDMLYGENDLYEGTSPYLPTDIKMGVYDIVIDNIIIKDDGSMYVRGKNFTNYSIILADGEEIETEYIDSETLRAVFEDVEELNEIKSIMIGQGKYGGKKIVFSNEYNMSVDIVSEDVDG